MFKRIFVTNLLTGMGLALVLGVGSAAEGPGEAESVAEDPVAKLVRIEKEVKVKEPVRSDGAAVEERSVGPKLEGNTALKKGDRVSIPEAGIAVIQYYDGCLYTAEGGTKGTEYEVNHEQCICQENLDASKHSQHDAIADLRDISRGDGRKSGDPQRGRRTLYSRQGGYATQGG